MTTEDDNSEPEASTAEHSDAPQFPDENITHISLQFHPQEWETHYREEYAVTARFVIPIEDAQRDDGSLIAEESQEMDTLKDHESAPDMVRDWSGPFEIRYDEFLDNPTLPDRSGIEDVTATVTFRPQIPLNGSLIIPDDTWSYTVPAADVLTDDGEILKDDTAASDRLAHHDEAPEIVDRWTVLTDWYFRITIDEFHVDGDRLSPHEFEHLYL